MIGGVLFVFVHRCCRQRSEGMASFALPSIVLACLKSAHSACGEVGKVVLVVISAKRGEPGRSALYPAIPLPYSRGRGLSERLARLQGSALPFGAKVLCRNKPRQIGGHSGEQDQKQPKLHRTVGGQ